MVIRAHLTFEGTLHAHCDTTYLAWCSGALASCDKRPQVVAAAKLRASGRLFDKQLLQDPAALAAFFGQIMCTSAEQLVLSKLCQCLDYTVAMAALAAAAAAGFEALGSGSSSGAWASGEQWLRNAQDAAPGMQQVAAAAVGTGLMSLQMMQNAITHQRRRAVRSGLQPESAAHAAKPMSVAGTSFIGDDATAASSAMDQFEELVDEMGSLPTDYKGVGAALHTGPMGSPERIAAAEQFFREKAQQPGMEGLLAAMEMAGAAGASPDHVMVRWLSVCSKHVPKKRRRYI